MIRYVILGFHHFGASCCFFRPHVEYAVRTPESIVDVHIRLAGHLIGGGCVACHIDGGAIGEGEHITNAFLHIMPAVEARLYRFHTYIRQIEYLMYAIDDRFFVRDDLAILISIGYFTSGAPMRCLRGTRMRKRRWPPPRGASIRRKRRWSRLRSSSPRLKPCQTASPNSAQTTGGHLVEKVTVHRKGAMTFALSCGVEIEI